MEGAVVNPEVDLSAVLIAIALMCIILPPDMDPLILLKERFEGWPKRDDPDWDPDKGWPAHWWYIFVIVIGALILGAVAFVIGYAS